MVICKRCKIEKTPDEFYPKKGTANGLNPLCKVCALAANKEWRQKNPELARQKNREANKRYYESESGKLAYRRRNARRYGLSIEEYNAILSENDGVCPICQSKPATHIDHCHDTGRVRGALCGGCNAALGAFGDSIDALKRAIKYLAAVSPLPDKE